MSPTTPTLLSVPPMCPPYWLPHWPKFYHVGCVTAHLFFETDLGDAIGYVLAFVTVVTGSILTDIGDLLQSERSLRCAFLQMKGFVCTLKSPFNMDIKSVDR